MFGKQLKQIRKSKNYTQRDLAIALSSKDEEFALLDLVTISRWEREVTSPTNAKALRVLRCLTTDVRPFLCSLISDEKPDELENFLLERFESNFRNMTLAAFEVEVTDNETPICHSQLFHRVDDNVIHMLRRFHDRYNSERQDLFNLDLYLYQEEHRIFSVRVHPEEDSCDVIGHTIAFFFNNAELYEEAKHCDVDFRQSIRFRDTKTCALYVATSFSSTTAVFRYQWGTFLDFLAKNANITEVYMNVLSGQLVDFLSEVGFEIIGTKTPVDIGGVKLGARRYERCVVRVDTSVLLTNKISLSLIKDFLKSDCNS